MFSDWNPSFDTSNPNKLHQFTLNRGQWLEIPKQPTFLRVLSGEAWVIVAKRDFVLASGQTQELFVDRYPAVVLGLGDQPVEVEVFSQAESRFDNFHKRLVQLWERCNRVLTTWLLPTNEPRITSVKGRNGEVHWRIDDPHTGRSHWCGSENDVMIWLDQRYH